MVNHKGRGRGQGRNFPGQWAQGRTYQGQWNKSSNYRVQKTGKWDHSSNYRVQKTVENDARFKIIQHKREKIKDARDRLAEIAKQTDARFKLNNLHTRNNQTKPPLKQITKGNVTVRRTKNGELSITTKNTHYKDVNTCDKEIQAGAMENFTVHPSYLCQNVPVQSTMENFTICSSYPCPNVPVQSKMENFTVHSSYVYPNVPIHTYAPNTRENGPYKWVKQPVHEPTASSPIQRGALRRPFTTSPIQRGALRRPFNTNSISKSPPHPKRPLLLSEREEWNSASERTRPPTVYTSMEADVYDDDVPMRTVRNLSSDLKSRLDVSGASDGFKVVVSNLQVTVKQKDIQELFGNIGPLLRSSLTHPGKAEVIFKHRADAEHSIDVYHNRLLDGQPLRCFLISGSYGSVASQSRPSESDLRVPTSVSEFRFPTGGRSSVLPDIPTIHKVLFNKS